MAVHIIPSLEEISKDKQWRVRLHMIHYFPKLFEFIDRKVQEEKLLPILIALLQDPVYSIREEAGNVLIEL